MDKKQCGSGNQWQLTDNSCSSCSEGCMDCQADGTAKCTKCYPSHTYDKDTDICCHNACKVCKKK